MRGIILRGWSVMSWRDRMAAASHVDYDICLAIHHHQKLYRVPLGDGRQN